MNPRKLYPFVDEWRWEWTHGTEYARVGGWPPLVVLHYELRPVVHPL